MYKEGYLKKLEALLADIDNAEIAEALQYYTEYFEDSEKDEAEVIKELGTPEEVAHSIREEMAEKEIIVNQKENYERFDSNGNPKGEQGFTKAQGNSEDGSKQQNSYNNTNENNTTRTILIVLLAAFIGVPIGIPLLSGIFGVVIGIYATLLALVFAAAVCGIAFGICAILCFFFGIGKLFISPLVGIIIVGAAFTLVGLCFLSILATWKLCDTVIPGLTRGIVYLCRLPFRKKEAMA